MAKKLLTIVILMAVAALVAMEYFAANVSAYALNELTQYQIRNMVTAISLAFVAADGGVLIMLSDKNPNAGSGYLLAGCFLASTMRAALIWQGLVFGFAATHPEWLAVAPVPLAALVWALNGLLIWLVGKAFQMPAGRL